MFAGDARLRVIVFHINFGKRTGIRVPPTNQIVSGLELKDLSHSATPGDGERSAAGCDLIVAEGYGFRGCFSSRSLGGLISSGPGTLLALSCRGLSRSFFWRGFFCLGLRTCLNYSGSFLCGWAVRSGSLSFRGLGFRRYGLKFRAVAIARRVFDGQRHEGFKFRAAAIAVLQAIHLFFIAFRTVNHFHLSFMGCIWDEA